jgi:hypothetical protein
VWLCVAIGTISREEFRRAMGMLGLVAAPGHVDALFNIYE